MPLTNEGGFLEKVTNRLISPSLLKQKGKQQDTIESITKIIEDHTPPLLCGYSMGGRILLEVLKRINYQPSVIALMGCALPLTDPILKKERMQRDRDLSQLIQNDFPRFLSNWYNSPLWSMDKKNKEELIKSYLLEYEDKFKRSTLSRLFTDYSPGVFPENQNEPYSFKDKFPDTTVLYFSGELDQKYCKEAKRYENIFQTFEHITVENVGHKLHQFQKGQKTINNRLLKELA